MFESSDKTFSSLGLYILWFRNNHDTFTSFAGAHYHLAELLKGGSGKVKASKTTPGTFNVGSVNGAVPFWILHRESEKSEGI